MSPRITIARPKVLEMKSNGIDIFNRSDLPLALGYLGIITPQEMVSILKQVKVFKR